MLVYSFDELLTIVYLIDVVCLVLCCAFFLAKELLSSIIQQEYCELTA